MANLLNTTKIGDNFETKSLDIIKTIIEKEQLGHLAKHIRIFQKKEYYSNLRKKNIIFDLTIEIWPPDAKRYSLIYIIECKDYKTRVPVSKIEDFHSKITQVAGVNVKGIFITNSPLQEAGLNIAESTGMMVIQGESSDEYQIILHKTNRNIKTTQIPFITNTVDRNIIDTKCEDIEKNIDKKILNVFKEDSETARVSYNIDRLTKEDIEQLANYELNKINSKILTESHILNLTTLYEYLTNMYGISIIEINPKSQLLGSCDILNKVIGINKSIKGGTRELFTLAHEFGHFILHQKLSISQVLYNNFDDSEYNFRKGKHDLINAKHWIEWQANYFATSLILPVIPFLARVYECQQILNRKQGKIYIDDNLDNIVYFAELIKKVSYRFNVSKTTIIYKLEELGQIRDNSRLKSLKQIITEYHEELLF